MPDNNRNKPQQPKRRRTPKQIIAWVFRFYRLCSHAHCRRGRACLGEGQPCFRIYWPQVPEGSRVWFHAMIKSRRDGATVDDAIAAGEAAAEQYLEMQAPLETMAEQRAPVQAPRREPPQPRVRMV